MANLKPSKPKKIILIGASSGGPSRVHEIICALPLLEDTSVIIAQHLVQEMMQSFEKRLQGSSKSPVDLIINSTALSSGKVFLAQGLSSLNHTQTSFQVLHTPHDTYNPNINTLFESFLPLCPYRSFLCVILTGIGNDGVQATKTLQTAGARCLTESAKSAIVDGMPSRAREAVADIEVLEFEAIIQEIKEFCS